MRRRSARRICGKDAFGRLDVLVCAQSGLKDGLNSFVIPLAMLLAKGEKLALGSLYLGSLCPRLDECVENVIRYVGRYDVVTYIDSNLL